MKKKLMGLLLLLLIHTSLAAQLTIEACYEQARANYPLIHQYELIALSAQYSLANISKSYLPQAVLNGQASYQSDVTKIPIDFTALGLNVSVPTMHNDQYRAALEVNQLLWDGGSTHAQKRVTQASSQVEQMQLTVLLYQIDEQINQLYFGILAINERLAVLALKEKDLLSNQSVIESMCRNGVAMQSDLDQMQVELLKLAQSRTELQWMKSAYCKMLSLFIHADVTADTPLVAPSESYVLPTQITRPELALYTLQLQHLDAQHSQVAAKSRPKLSFFAQGGYGRPGFDMLNAHFTLFGIAGLKLSWNLGNFYTQRNEKRMVQVGKSSVEVQQETFLFKTNLELVQEWAEIEKYKSLVARDNEIIALRTRIKQASQSKFQNGVYRTHELIQDINAEEEARHAKALNQVMYLLSIYKYKHTHGK